MDEFCLDGVVSNQPPPSPLPARTPDFPPVLESARPGDDQGSFEDMAPEVLDFLSRITFQRYAYILRKEGFTCMEALSRIDMDDLVAMKVKRGHAKLILLKIEQSSLLPRRDSTAKFAKEGAMKLPAWQPSKTTSNEETRSQAALTLRGKTVLPEKSPPSKPARPSQLHTEFDTRTGSRRSSLASPITTALKRMTGLHSPSYSRKRMSELHSPSHLRVSQSVSHVPDKSFDFLRQSKK